jgi:hypothetical protein
VAIYVDPGSEVVIVQSRYLRRATALVLAGALVVLGALAVTPPAAAGPASEPTVDIESAVGMAPDGRSVTVGVLGSCPDRWAVVEAVVAISQPPGVGQASFPLSCIGSVRRFTVTVSAAAGTFRLGAAEATGSVLIRRGRTAQAVDSDVVHVQPTVVVEIADSARLESGGAVVLAVAVACPAGVTGLQSNLNVSQGGAIGNGSYIPICDGERHSFPVEVSASEGAYQVGAARALTFAVVDHEGVGFYGVDDRPIQITN